MLRVGSLMRLAAFAAVFVLVVAETSEAQRKKQGRQRNRQGGNRFGGGRFGGGNISILKNKYLQEELKFTAAQKKRINEIDIQLSGNRALQREDVQKALGITETQKTKLADANKANDDKRRELFGSLFGGRRGGGGNAKRPNREELTKKFAELRTAGDKAIFAVLTTSQKAKFEKMKGKAIDRTKLFQRRTPRRKRPEL
ncbi:MAG: hypothetical protein IID46_01935 [Planctomycetes bacterium]|nr:hypothetical protein [Planctomycetota bacterium]